MEREVRYCTTEDGVRLAYTVAGEGYPLVRSVGWATHVEYDLAKPLWRPMLEPLTESFQLVLYDGRGTGLSDRHVEEHSLEQWVTDLEAVVNAIGLKRFALLGISQGGSTAIDYSTRHADLVSHLILYGSFARAPANPRNPRSRELYESLVTMARVGWGQNHPTFRQVFTAMFIPRATVDQQQMFDEMQRLSMNAEEVVALLRAISTLDVRELLPRVTVPTLVLHRREDQVAPFRRGRELAAGIPGARLIPLEGENHIYAEGEPGISEYVDAIASFVLGELPAKPDAGRLRFRTVLFTDLVGHTEMMSRLGDEKGRQVLREHERITREVLKAHGGTEVKTMGDGFMASFGSVTKAVECAIALQQALAAREGEPLSVRVGLNAGEPIEEDGDLFGATVILASRIAGKADAGEILVADTVRGLCSGKGFLFADRGEFVAKGFEEPVRVYEVRWQDGSILSASHSRTPPEVWATRLTSDSGHEVELINRSARDLLDVIVENHEPRSTGTDQFRRAVLPFLKAGEKATVSMKDEPHDYRVEDGGYGIRITWDRGSARFRALERKRGAEFQWQRS